MMLAYPLQRQRHATAARERLLSRLEEFLYRLLIVPLVAFLPAPLAYGIACLRGDWCCRLNASLRARIIDNLAAVLGDRLSAAERRQVARDYFRRRSCEAIDVMRLVGKGRALARLVEIRGLEHIEAALAAGKGAMLCSAHAGSFNVCFSLIGARGFPITVVGDWRSHFAAHMSPLQRFLWRLIHERPLARHRRRSNIEPEIDRFGAAMRMVDILRANEVVAMGIETPVAPEDRARAIPVTFLGQRMLLLPGCTDVARLTGSPLLLLTVRRLPDWRHQVLEISPPVAQDEDSAATFRRCIAMLETPVRQQPAVWDWWVDSEGLLEAA
jgi:KDO2-lipid IV(A) lauroyltransferase